MLHFCRLRRVLFPFYTALLFAVSILPLEAEDGSELYIPNFAFFTAAAPDQLTESGLIAAAETWVQSGADMIFFCPNGQKANFKSKGREEIWAEVDHFIPDDPWPQNAMKLDAAGLDPYKIWIETVRKHQVSPWLCMTMNDISGVEDWTDFRNSTFWVHRPHYWIIGSCPRYRMTKPADRALDFNADQVKDHALLFVQTLLDRYDMDGLALDWKTGGQFFDYGREKERGKILTDLMGIIKEKADAAASRLNHPLRLAVRVAATPEESDAAGVFAAEWAQKGLIDAVVPIADPSDTAASQQAWQEALSGTKTAVLIEKSL